MHNIGGGGGGGARIILSLNILACKVSVIKVSEQPLLVKWSMVT